MKLKCITLRLFLSIISHAILSQTPGDNFDLSHWKLQGLDDSLNRISIYPSELESGFTNQWFYSTTSNNMFLKCPSNGESIVKGGSPRVELRQTGDWADWSINDSKVHKLKVRCYVHSSGNGEVLPKVNIGQIHGREHNTEMVKLVWKGYKDNKCLIEARLQEDSPERTEYRDTLAQNLSLGDEINYEITMCKGKVEVKLNGKSTSQTYTSLYYGTADKYYFKAGCYFSKGTSENIYGLVEITKLELTKPYDYIALAEANGLCSEVLIYPNPTTQYFTIESSGKELSAIAIYTLSGEQVYQSRITPPKLPIDEPLFPGIYLVKTMSSDSKIDTQILIVE